MRLLDREFSVRILGALSLYGLVTLGTLALSHSAGAEEPQLSNLSLRPLCALWDGQASEAISQRVIEGKSDVDLRKLSDDIFRMRRARRSCELGSIRTACEDYLAILRSVGGTSNEWQGSTSVCPLAMADERAQDYRQTERR